MTKRIEITWRDEGYGQIAAGGIAFRTGYTGDLSDRSYHQFEIAAKKAGFTFHHGRCSWNAYDRGADRRLVAELERRGFEVTHDGFWSKEA